MRLKSCKKCGKTFNTNRRDAYMCPECSLQAKRDSVIRERTCRSCGISFMGGPRAWYCPECRDQRTKEANKRFRKNKTARPLGSIDICSVCGKEYIVNSARQKYCKACAEEAIKEIVRPQKIEYYQKNKDTLSSHKEEMRTNGYVCAFCGKVFDKTTPTVTCSEECAKGLINRRQKECDYRRGKRKIPPDQIYDSGLPKSGVTGVTYHRLTHKWQSKYKNKYLGLFSTIEDAAIAIDKYKNSL